MTEERAVELAKALAQRLGGGWRIIVSRDFTYRYSCVWRHMVRITPTDDGRFQTYLKAGKKHDNWASAKGDTPKQALMALVVCAKNTMKTADHRHAYDQARGLLRRIPDDLEEGMHAP